MTSHGVERSVSLHMVNEIYSAIVRGETLDSTRLKLSAAERAFWAKIEKRVRLETKRGGPIALADDIPDEESELL